MKPCLQPSEVTNERERRRPLIAGVHQERRRGARKNLTPNYDDRRLQPMERWRLDWLTRVRRGLSVGRG